MNPEFFHESWKSLSEKEGWSPTFHALSKRIIRLERESIGVTRQAALQYLTMDEYFDIIKEGYYAFPVAKSDIPHYHMRALIFKEIPKNIDFLLAVYHDPEVRDKIYGELLGYPECCINHFQEHWKDNQHDPTRFMHRDSFNWRCNILMRWYGVRTVFHLPCSFNCEATKELADKHLELLDAPAAETLETILSAPMFYSTYHGVAEISTPSVKFCVPSDVLKEKVEFGVNTSNVYLEPVNNWTANGFSSKMAQDKAHNFVISAIRDLKFNSICDYGCGNGLLLKKVYDATRVGSLRGVDTENKLLPNYGAIIVFTEADFIKMNMATYCDVALISKNRFDEGAKLELIANDGVKYLIVTSYNGPFNERDYRPGGWVCTYYAQDSDEVNAIAIYARLQCE